MGFSEGIITTIIIVIIISITINVAIFFAIMKIYTINNQIKEQIEEQEETNAILKVTLDNQTQINNTLIEILKRENTSLNIQTKIEQNTRNNK